MNKKRIGCIVMAAVCFALTVFGILMDTYIWNIVCLAFLTGFSFSEALNIALIQKYEEVLKEVDKALDRLIECMREENNDEEAADL